MPPTWKCPKCGGTETTTETVAKPIGETAIVARGHEIVRCAVDGSVLAESFHRAGELASLVMAALVRKAQRLTPAEFVWLRKRNGWKSNELAASLGVTPSTVSRWESGAAPIQSTADRALRLMVVATGRVGLFDVGELAKIDDNDTSPLELELELGPAGWTPVLAHGERKAS